MAEQAFNPMGNTTVIAASGTSAVASNSNPQCSGFYIANRNGAWAFVVPGATSGVTAAFPAGSSAPTLGIAIPPNAAVTVRWPGALWFAGILTTGAGPIDITPTDGGT